MSFIDNWFHYLNIKKMISDEMKKKPSKKNKENKKPKN